MANNIVIGGLLFTSIIILSMFVNTTEYFKSPDSVLDSIQKLKYAYNSLKQPLISDKKINTPKGEMAVSDVIQANLVNISTLEKTYSEMLNGPQLFDSQNIKNTVKKSIKELSNRYNYIIKTLSLKLPVFKNIKIPKTGSKTATEIAVENTKVDPVLIAIQTVQDSFISLKDEIIRGGSRSIATPKGDISALKIVEENITIINKLAEKYTSMIHDKASNSGAKKYVQTNLNTVISTYNYITKSLNIKRNLLQKNMIKMKKSPVNQKAVAEPIAGQKGNKILTVPMEKLNKNKSLVIQLSTHGTDALQINSTVKASASVCTPPKNKPKPFSQNYIFKKLSTVYDTLPTQNSMI